jgi:serine protease Do
VRYAYGLTSALLLGGATLSLMTGSLAGAQVAQNDQQQMSTIAPKAGAPGSFADLTQQLQPAVVNISTRQKVRVQGGANPFAGTPLEGFFGGGEGASPTTREAQSLGSGFIISTDGFVVTNNHVITAEGQGQVESITVILPDGAEYPATLVGKDTISDLAVLKINAGKPLPFVKFGDSAKARVGDWVVAIGNPFGLGGTVTAGIISAVYRNIGSGSADRYLQTDAAINHGNSGGPMFDMKGQVIGINQAIYSPTGGSVGIGFAIPSEIAAPVVERLMKGQTIERGYLGVRIQPLSDDLAESMGLPHNKGEIVQGVEPGKAAAQAGIKAGDVVLKVNNREVNRSQTLSFLVASTAPGTKIPIEVLRDGKTLTIIATVSRRPSEEELAEQSLGDRKGGKGKKGAPAESGAPSLAETALGLQLLPMRAGIARELGVPEDTKGVVVNGIDPSSDAAAKEMQPGDIILAIGDQPVTTLADVDTGIRAAKAAGRSAVRVLVAHPGRPTMYIGLRLR